MNAISIVAGIVAGIMMLATENIGGISMLISGALGIMGDALSEQLASAAGMAIFMCIALFKLEPNFVIIAAGAAFVYHIY